MGAHMLPCLRWGGEVCLTRVANVRRCQKDPASRQAAFPFFPKGHITCLDSFLTRMGFLVVLIQICLGLEATIIATLTHIAKASMP